MVCFMSYSFFPFLCPTVNYDDDDMCTLIIKAKTKNNNGMYELIKK